MSSPWLAIKHSAWECTFSLLDLPDPVEDSEEDPSGCWAKHRKGQGPLSHCLERGELSRETSGCSEQLHEWKTKN